jgi:hypothetical protein
VCAREKYSVFDEELIRIVPPIGESIHSEVV